MSVHVNWNKSLRKQKRRGADLPRIEFLESRQFLSATTAAVASDVSARDTAFLRTAASGDMQEITLGNMAQTKGSSQQIKAVAAQMVTDHTASLQILQQDATALGVTIPPNLNAHDQGVVNFLATLNGTKFDTNYSQYMVLDHRQEISRYTVENRVANDTTIKTLTSNELPVLQTHLSLWTDAELTVGDVAFVQRATSGNMLEVMLGTLAQTSASNQQVKAAGQTMVTDHSVSGAALAQTATTLGITVSTSLSVADQGVYTQLSKLTGSRFDSAYSTYMVIDHRREIADYTQENRLTHNSLLKTYTSDNIPVLQTHLALWTTTVKAL